MTDIVICNPLRTPVGRMGGALSALTATELATHTLRALVERTGLGECDVDDVVLGHGYPEATPPASHLDLHRLAGLADEDPALLEPYVGPGVVAFVEWPEVAERELAALGRVAVRVRLVHDGADRRRITVT